MNKNDLKWCKDIWDLSSPNFTQIVQIDNKHSKCNKSHQPDNFVPNGQDILVENIGNGLFYNCFNRADENPFKNIGFNQSEDEGDKSWSDWVKEPCKFGDYYRRCLGQKPNQCIAVEGWYI